MPERIELDRFAAEAAALAERVAAEGETIVIERDGVPVAVLASHASVASLSSVVDMPRWESWLKELRESFPEAAARLAKVRDEPEPEELSKPYLGFDPGVGQVGSEEGRAFLAGELQRLNVPVRDEKLLGEIYAAVLQLCEDKERIYEADLRVLAQELIAEAPQRLRLLSVTVTSSSGLPATAEVTLELGHGPAMRREHGDGPLDAAINAIERMIGLRAEVRNFSVVAATKGRDAMAEAVIELAFEGSTVLGAGASTDVIQAGVHAYVNALNFLLEGRREPAGTDVESG